MYATRYVTKPCFFCKKLGVNMPAEWFIHLPNHKTPLDVCRIHIDKIQPRFIQFATRIGGAMVILAKPIRKE